MSLTDDLALVTACRDRASWQRFPQWEITDAALSLIEDTLNDHAPQKPRATSPRITPFCCYCIGGNSGESRLIVDFPCADYRRAIAALHTIATALGVPTSNKIIPTDLGGL